IRCPLRTLSQGLSAKPVRIGFEALETSEPASYAAMHLYGGTMRTLIEETFSVLGVAPADEALDYLRARKTAFEIEKIRTACRIAERALQRGFEQIKTGASEVEIAATFRQPLSASLVDFPEVSRADGFAWCMSGANSALASAAYARSRPKRVAPGDLVLVHMNSYADGYWTDITRTYSIGKPDERRQAMY